MLMLWYRTGIPFVTMMVYHCGALAFARSRGSQRPSRHDIHGAPPAVLVALVVYVSYCIDTFADFLKILHCVEISSPEHPYAKYEVLGSSELWTGDTSLECWEGTHLWSSIAASVGLLGLVGSLCFMVKILKKGKKEDRLANPGFMLKYGILYLAYKQDGIALYWEAIITLRKILLAAIGEFGKYTEVSGAQMGLAAITIFAFLVLHQIIAPFHPEDSSETFPSYAGSVLRLVGARSLSDRWVSFNKKVTLNGLEAASLHMSLSLFFTAASIVDTQSQKDDASDFLVAACFSLNVIYVSFMFYRLWYGLHHYLDVIAVTRGVSFENGENKTFLPTKIWVLAVTETPKDEEDTTQNASDLV